MHTGVHFKRRTRIINLYGAPSSGKTVKMLQLATVAKLRGEFCEVCPEVAKEYVIQEIPITAQVQREITVEQYRRMRRFAGYVDYLVTDAPIMIGGFYAQDHAYPETGALMAEFRGFCRELQGMADMVNVYVTREHAFVQHGRYQTEAHAVKIERDMLAYVRQQHDVATLLEVGSKAEVEGLWELVKSARVEPAS